MEEHLKKNIKVENARNFSEEQLELLNKKIFYNFYISKEVPFLYVAGDTVYKVSFSESKLTNDEEVNLFFKLEEIRAEDTRLT